MFVASLALLILLQQKDDGPIVLSPGTSRAFQSAVLRVKDAADAGDWAEAARLAGRLPERRVRLVWDDSAVDEARRGQFRAARDAAIAKWAPTLDGVSIEVAATGQLKVSFVPDLPPNVDSPGPAAAVHLSSPDEADPVQEAVISLRRGQPARTTEKLDVENEVAFAIGAYFGLAKLPKPGPTMFRTERPFVVKSRLTLSGRRLALGNLDLADRIRTAVSARKPFDVATAEIFLSPSRLDPAPVRQAEEMSMMLQVTNRGDGILEYFIVPDCSCFALGPHNRTVKPGETELVPIRINTLNFVGRLKKALYVYSNDPEFPVRRVPLDAIVRPIYRFVSLNNEPALIVGDAGAKYELLFVLDEETDMKVKRVAVTGVSAVVQFEPWEGVLDNPEIGEGPKKRRGYKITALVSPGIPTGRANMTIRVDTDDDVFKTLYHNVVAQHGIVPVPLTIYFGEISQEPARAHTVISRPGRPYKILGVESDVDFIKPSVEPYQGQTAYKIVAEFDGTAPLGRFLAMISVRTDDPKQPVVTVPVEGIVK
ncbi:MAG: hypothetical protein IIC73_02935 [Armatimonadetes bacterium]|nr:hypothetical protein [Armatimonadota bacterium]